jgi:branched-subunit amino acid aminotransferase/4-amino-4-deoxychorismate lyase
LSPIIHIDGEPATVEALAPVILSNYGAFTSMQVEDGAARGLDLHLDRLQQEALALFGRAVPEARLRERMRMALAGLEGRHSLRVQLFLETITHRTPDAMGEPSVLTVVSAPANPLCDPLRLQTQDYAREAPELKHNATFGLTRARRAAKAASFDDALFVGPNGVVSEGTIWNIGFARRCCAAWGRGCWRTGWIWSGWTARRGSSIGRRWRGSGRPSSATARPRPVRWATSTGGRWTLIRG